MSGVFKPVPPELRRDLYHESGSRMVTMTLALGYAAINSGMNAADGMSTQACQVMLMELYYSIFLSASVWLAHLKVS